MLFRCAGITDSCTDGLEFSPAICIFFQGCKFNCFQCQNPELRNMNGGDLVDTDDVLAMIDKHKDFYKGTVFTGGDPTFQLDALVELASKIGQGKVLYTGNTYDELPESVRSLFDIIVDGRYIEELKTGGFPASENQIVHRKPT